MMWIAVAVVAVLVVLLIGFLALCRTIGKQFMKNLARKNPGDNYDVPDVDVSFYTKGPMMELTKKGLAFMDTLPHEEVFIKSYDGLKLHATLFPGKGKNFVLGIHGFQSQAWNQFAPFIEYYQSKGWGMLLTDDRGHWQSEGDYITMGVKDRLDCVSWAQYLADRFGSDCKILLHGVSMGGATVLSASGEEGLPKEVIGVVSDCGFYSAREAFSHQMESLYHIDPKFPMAVGAWYAKRQAHFDFDEARPIDQVQKARVPILFVQGSKDFMVPEDMAKKLYAACTSRKKLLIVPGANHGESIGIDPEAYHKAIEEMYGI